MQIALIGLKGGTGKTTAAVSLAQEAHARGQRVLLVDLDPLGSAHHWARAAIEHAQDVPTTLYLGQAELDVELLTELGTGYDLVVFDAPSGDVGRLETVLAASDLALIPCGASAMDVWALGPTLAAVERAQADKPGLGALLLGNRKDPRTSAGRRMRELLRDTGWPVLATVLGARSAFADALEDGQTARTLDPKGASAAEVRGLFEELQRMRAPVAMVQ